MFHATSSQIGASDIVCLFVAMSNGYNSRLAPGYDKGKCGDTEFFDDEGEDVLREKCSLFADLVRNAKHVVIHTGAGALVHLADFLRASSCVKSAYVCLFVEL